VVVAIGVWAVVGRGGGGGGDPDADDEAASEVRERTDEERAADAAADDRQDDARRAFAQASRRLELGGSYSYHGTVHAPAASDARPAHGPASDVTVDGEVQWPLRTHDVAVDASGRAVETITVGPSIWQRAAPSEDRLTTTPYAFVGDVATWNSAVVPFGAGAARLPGWLTATTDRARRSTADGRRTFVATLPAGRLGDVGAGEPRTDAEVVLTVDAEGDPLRIEVALPGEAATGSAWRVSLDISAIGDPVAIDVPDGQLPSVTEGPTPAEVRAAGIAAPVELGQMPEGWALMEIGLVRSGQGRDCPRLELAYGDIDAPAGRPRWLDLHVLPPGCLPLPPAADATLRAGAFVGAGHLAAGGRGGSLSDGRTDLDYTSSLPTADVLRLLATLEPYDPATRPTALTATP
jgi:hypothetical protein